jgi:hypothetical protein
MYGLLASQGSEEGVDGRLQMLFQDESVPETIDHCLFNNGCIHINKLLIPLRRCSALDNRKRFSVVEVSLPVREIQDHTEIVPGEDAAHTGAASVRIDALDMLIRLFVDHQHFLPLFAQ